MFGILFTTRDEASVFIDQYPDDRFDALEKGTPVHVDNVLVATSGPGKINAALTTERLLRAHELTALVHSGTCTALDESLSIGTVVGASFVLEGDRVELDDPTYPRMPLECPFDVSTEGTLVSQDFTGHRNETEEGSPELSYWERLADVRDGTGYAVAYVAAQHGIPCHIAKAVLTHRTHPSTPERADRDEAYEAIGSFIEHVTESDALTSEE